LISFDTAGTTISGGNVIASFYLTKEESKDIDISKYESDMAPGEKLTISATSAEPTEVFVSINIQEDL